MLTIADPTVSIGIHSKIPAAAYHEADACSNSRLSILHESCPAKLKYCIDNPQEPSDAMRIGSALHCLVLEPAEFRAAFAVAPKCDRRTKEGKATWAAFAAEACGMTVLDDDDFALVSAMAASIDANGFARDALNAAPEREASAFWEDPQTGLMCKARFDALGREAALIVDLKTTENAGREFERSIDKYGIARQSAFYMHGAAVLGVPVSDFLIIAVEKTPPYLVGLHRITEEAIELAAKELRPLIETYWQCVSTNLWPGYMSMDTGLPAWAKNRIEQQTKGA